MMDKTTYYWQDNCEIWECQYVWIDEGDGHQSNYKVPFTEKLYKRLDTTLEAKEFLKGMRVIK